VRVILGPQQSTFTPEAQARFLTTAYEITPNADRMGIRLRGDKIRANPPDIVSDGIVTGSVQIPPDGQPIVMMVDHQTTGGYPKIATVIQTDLPLLAQVVPGSRVTFSAVSIEEAQTAYKQAAQASIPASPS
jgi:allophanate hydrolase subunit 2